MKAQEFLATHPVFRAEEFGEFPAGRASQNTRTRDSLLAHYVKTGRLLRVRRGLYAVVPPGQTPETLQSDPFLLASRMTPDAVLAYHTALEFHGRAYSAFQEFTYLTRATSRSAEFRGNTFRGVAFAKSLLEKNQERFGVETADRFGLEVRVASLERTLVDVLDRPAISGGWEEIWRSLESVEFFDLEQVTEYALLLDNATTVAKVGFYLEQHAEQLMVEEPHLSRLRAHVPKTAHYLDRSTRGPARLADPWNLIVPERILNRTWTEQSLRFDVSRSLQDDRADRKRCLDRVLGVQDTVYGQIEAVLAFAEDMGATIDDIARIAGVHRSTVARALRGEGRMTTETRARIRKIAADMRFRPSYAASVLSVGRSNVVAVVANSRRIGAFSAVCDFIQMGLREAGYSMMLYGSGESAEDESRCLEQLLEHRVAGAIVHPNHSPASIDLYQFLVDSGVKLVIADGCIEGLPVPQITPDQYMVGRMSAEYLISLGHRRVAYLAVPRASYIGRERARGFLDAMADAGIPASESAIVETEFGEESGRESMARLLEGSDRPTGVVARHDSLAVGAMRAVFDSGLSVPEDVSIVGYGDVTHADMLRVPLTTVRNSAHQIAAVVLDRILGLLAGRDAAAVTEFIPGELVLRASCAPPGARRTGPSQTYSAHLKYT